MAGSLLAWHIGMLWLKLYSMSGIVIYFFLLIAFRNALCKFPFKLTLLAAYLCFWLSWMTCSVVKQVTPPRRCSANAGNKEIKNVKVRYPTDKCCHLSLTRVMKKLRKADKPKAGLKMQISIIAKAWIDPYKSDVLHTTQDRPHCFHLCLHPTVHYWLPAAASQPAPPTPTSIHTHKTNFQSCKPGHKQIAWLHCSKPQWLPILHTIKSQFVMFSL